MRNCSWIPLWPNTTSIPATVTPNKGARKGPMWSAALPHCVRCTREMRRGRQLRQPQRWQECSLYPQRAQLCTRLGPGRGLHCTRARRRFAQATLDHSGVNRRASIVAVQHQHQHQHQHQQRERFADRAVQVCVCTVVILTTHRFLHRFFQPRQPNPTSPNAPPSRLMRWAQVLWFGQGLHVGARHRWKPPHAPRTYLGAPSLASYSRSRILPLLAGGRTKQDSLICII